MTLEQVLCVLRLKNFQIYQFENNDKAYKEFYQSVRTVLNLSKLYERNVYDYIHT